MLRNILLSSLDHTRLHDLLSDEKLHDRSRTRLLRALDHELGRATIVPPDEIPPYTVTMNTCVCLVDVETGEEMKYTLVYPRDADLDKGQLSILSDIGVAILGSAVGDTIECKVKKGARRLHIDMIYFQPEALKHYTV